MYGDLAYRVTESEEHIEVGDGARYATPQQRTVADLPA
jgi:hypothetical protein